MSTVINISMPDDVGREIIDYIESQTPEGQRPARSAILTNLLLAGLEAKRQKREEGLDGKQ